MPVIHDGLDFPEVHARWSACVYHADKVRKSGDIIAALDGFVGALDAGIYPALGILELLRDGFRNYAKAGGSKTLDEIFGLAPAGPGKSHALKESALRKRDYYNNTCVDILHRHFGIPYTDAAYMVSDRQATLYPDEFTPSGETIADQYRSQWKAEFSLGPCRFDVTPQREFDFPESFPINTLGVITKKRIDTLKKELREQIAISSRD